MHTQNYEEDQNPTTIFATPLKYTKVPKQCSFSDKVGYNYNSPKAD